jgi:hypothetical protein
MAWQGCEVTITIECVQGCEVTITIECVQGCEVCAGLCEDERSGLCGCGVGFVWGWCGGGVWVVLRPVSSGFSGSSISITSPATHGTTTAVTPPMIPNIPYPTPALSAPTSSLMLG